MRSNKDEFSLEINEHYSVLGCVKTVRISQIRGFKPGSVYGHKVKLLTSPLVKKDVNGYVLLNYGDPRVSSILNKYDSNTKVEVMIIPEEHTETIRFLAGELNPQITPSTRFTDFFTSLSQSHSKQILVRDFFVKQASRSKSKLAFNLKRFIEKLGANAPTQSTASKLVSSANSVDVSKPTLNKTRALDEHSAHTSTDTSQHTQKTQESEIIDKEEALVEAAAESYYSSEPRSEESYSDETFGPDSEQELTEEEMNRKWEQHSNSTYSFSLLREILDTEENKALSERLNKLQPGTIDFKNFLHKILKLVESRLSGNNVYDHNN